MDSQRLEEIKERLSKATPGPWVCQSAQKGAGEDVWVETRSAMHDETLTDAQIDALPESAFDSDTICDALTLSYYGIPGHESINKRNNLDFIAHTREDVPWLLQQLAETAAVLEQVQHRHRIEINGLHQQMNDLRAERDEYRKRVMGDTHAQQQMRQLRAEISILKPKAEAWDKLEFETRAMQRGFADWTPEDWEQVEIAEETP